MVFTFAGLSTIAPYHLHNRLKPATEGGGFGIMFVRGGVVICVL